MQLMIPRRSLSKVLPAFRYPLGIQVIGEMLESLLEHRLVEETGDAGLHAAL
ncbi:hypothetical protein R6Y96_05400 [Methanoculleus receptaculi]|uniref:Uncharacterized protein n=1 Tax=Methanoculleus receptaculi TaxID=394967 RepID=A0AAX4FTH5_9EURY|nr:hypothetical protein [Methanoculleus receptaculi]WOX56763.1 hypothetical protein R6Y96_05400 [Methanoculleus receptaculi]